MPETTQKELIVIEVSGEQAKSALDQLLEAIGKVEQAVVGMGGKLDATMQRIVEPINGLTMAVDKLNTSVGLLDARLGQAAGLDLLGQKAKQAQIDLADLDRQLQQYRATGMTGEVYRQKGDPHVSSRRQMVERIMAERAMAEPNPPLYAWSEQMKPGPFVGTPARGQRPFVGGEEVGKEWKEQFPPDVVRQIEEQIAAEEKLIGTIEQQSAAEDQLTASTGRAIAEQLRQRANWEQMVIAGERVAAQLRQQSTELTRRAGAAVTARLREGRPEVIGQAYARAGVPVTPKLERGAPAVGDWEAEAKQIGVLEAAIGRKIVVQKLMARGSRDVAERFEKQFTVTRSKEEILREINRTGKMTTEMEKELGLQTERTGRQARRAGGMMRYFGRYLLRYLILWQGIQAVRGISKAWFAAHLEMADAVADFGWRVNATADDVDRYRDKLRDVSTMVGMPVGQIASPFAGKATEAELLRAAEASKVFGGSVEDWLRTLQKGDVTLDAFAHGLRISTLATEDYAKLIGNADDIAKEFNITQAEAIGLLSSLPSVLRTDAEGAAELTEALAGLYEQNQLLMTLGVAPAVTVGPGGAPQRRPMPEVMAEIGRLPIERQRQLAIAIGLTNEAQQRLFLDAVAGWNEVQQAIRGTVGATGDMEDAIAGADASMKAHVASMKAAWTSLLEAIGATDAAIEGVEGLTNVFMGLTTIVDGTAASVSALLLETLSLGEALAIVAGLIVSPTLTIPMLMAGFGKVSTAEKRAGAGGAAGPGRGYAGVTPGPEPEPGAAYFPPMPTLRMQAGMGIGQLAAEMERVIDEVFTRPYVTASGEVIQVTKEQIDALRQNTVILDETGEAIGLLNVYAPALAVAQENLKTEVAKFSLERLKDVTPEEFERAKRDILPMWEARLATVPGFEEQQELQNFFVGMDDTFMQMLGTETAISYTLQDILDVEKDQLEGMWNIPTGVTMRVPLQSLDLMRWMKGAGGGAGIPTDLMGPLPPALEAAANAQDAAAIAMQASAGAQTTAAASMSQLAQNLGAKIYGDVPVEPGVAKEAALDGGLQAGVNRRRPIAGGAGKVVPMAPTGMPTGVGALTAQIAINLVSTLFLDKKVVAEVVQTELSRRLVNTARGAGGGGAAGGLRP